MCARSLYDTPHVHAFVLLSVFCQWTDIADVAHQILQVDGEIRATSKHIATFVDAGQSPPPFYINELAQLRKKEAHLRKEKAHLLADRSYLIRVEHDTAHSTPSKVAFADRAHASGAVSVNTETRRATTVLPSV